jgi:hypothetical protein
VSPEPQLASVHLGCSTGGGVGDSKKGGMGLGVCNPWNGVIGASSCGDVGVSDGRHFGASKVGMIAGIVRMQSSSSSSAKVWLQGESLSGAVWGDLGGSLLFVIIKASISSKVGLIGGVSSSSAMAPTLWSISECLVDS